MGQLDLKAEVSDVLLLNDEENVAARPDEEPAGMIKIAMSFPRWRKIFPKLGFSGSFVVEIYEIQFLGVITSKEEVWAR